MNSSVPIGYSQMLNPFHQQHFISPFNEAMNYYFMAMVLSMVIVIALIILELCEKEVVIIPQAFSSMLSVRKRRISCFGVDVTVTPTYRTIATCCKATLRIAIVSTLCFFWQGCVLYQTTFSADFDKAAETAASYCMSGLICFYYSHLFNLTFRWRSEDIEEVCHSHPDSWNALSRAQERRSGYISCLGIPRVDLLQVSIYAAILYSLFKLQLASFELATWFVYRSKGNCVQIFLLCFSILTIALYFVALFIPQIFFIDTWFASISYLSIPVILISARMAGMSVQGLSKERLNLDGTSLLICVPAKDTFRVSSTVGNVEEFTENLNSVTKLIKADSLTRNVKGKVVKCPADEKSDVYNYLEMCTEKFKLS